MKLPDSLLLLPIKRARIVILSFFLITIASALLIFFRHNAALQNCLSQASTWQHHAVAKQDLTAPSANTLLMGIGPRDKKTPLISPKGVQSIYTIDDAIEDLAANGKKPNLIAPDYITAKNIDLILPGELGSINFIPFLRPAPENQEQAEQLFRQAGEDPLLNSLVLSSTGNQLLYHLPLLSKGSTLPLQAAMEQATSEANTVHLLFGGLPYITETYLTELHKSLPFTGAVTMVLVMLITAAATSSTACTAGVVFTPLSAATVTYAVQVLFSFPTTFFSFLPPVTAFAAALVLGTIVSTKLDNTPARQNDEHASLPLTYKKIQFHITVTAAPGLAFLLLLGVPEKSIQLLGLFIPLGLCIAWLTSLSLTPALFAALSEIKLKKLPVPRPSFSVSPLGQLTRWGSNNPVYVLTIHIVLFSLAALGMASLTIKETPLHWFHKNHPVVQDEHTLNATFNGVHQLRLILSATPEKASMEENRKWLEEELKSVFKHKPDFLKILTSDVEAAAAASTTSEAFAEHLAARWQKNLQEVAVNNDLQIARWSVALDILSELTYRTKVFLRPDMLEYVKNIQHFALAHPQIRKTLSVADFITQAHQALFEGDPARAHIPSTTNGAVQALEAYKKRRILGLTPYFINENATKVNLTFFTTTRDPTQLTLLSHTITAFLKTSPAPVPLQAEWAGNAYSYGSWQRNTTFALLLGMLAAFITGGLLTAILHKSVKQGIFSLITAGYILFLAFGLGGLFFNTSGIIFSATLFVPLVTVLLLAGFKLSSMRENLLTSGSWKDENRSSQWMGLLISLCAGVSMLAFFSAYSPLRTTGLMTITSMVAVTATFFLALPLLMNTFQTVLFKKEVRVHTARMAALAAQSESMEGTAPENDIAVEKNNKQQSEQPATDE